MEAGLGVGIYYLGMVSGIVFSYWVLGWRKRK